jgi:hypothetical protein
MTVKIATKIVGLNAIMNLVHCVPLIKLLVLTLFQVPTVLQLIILTALWIKEIFAIK